MRSYERAKTKIVYVRSYECCRKSHHPWPLPLPYRSVEEQLFYSCPALRADVAGVCVKTCDSDTDCTGFNKCCYNGCGHTCRQPEIIPYLPLPQRCPPELGNEPCSVNGDELTCIDSCGEGGEEEEEDEDSDSSESTSESSHRDLMCCDNMCGGSVCLPPAIDPTPCFTMRGLVDSANATLVGAYRPHCASNGKFLEVQCRSDYCWCVDMLTGRPRSHLVAFHSTDDLHCTRELSLVELPHSPLTPSPHTHTHTHTHRLSLLWLCVRALGHIPLSAG